MTTAPILLTRVDPARNMARYYFLALQPGLFEEWGVVREWGRIGSPGQVRTDWHGSEAAAAAAQAKLTQAKLRRGYRWSRARRTYRLEAGNAALFFNRDLDNPKVDTRS